MMKRSLNIIVSLITASLFLLLAFRNVEFAELMDQLKTISLNWIPFFLICMIASHYLRAERWMMLIRTDGKKIPTSSLFAGVMIGYFFNNLVPRLGEISRPVYVARQQKLSSGNLIGTIVLERLIDIVSMLVITFFVFIYLINDVGQIRRIFGIEGWTFFHYMIIPAVLISIILFIYLLYRVLLGMNEKKRVQHPVLLKIIETVRSFSEGLVSVKYVRNWPVFLVLTAGIWLGYILMMYLPFYMFDLTTQFGLSFQDAIVLTMVSSVGVSIPTPAGIGSYHLFIQQSMWLLYGIPLSTALAFATVAHAATMIFIFLITPFALWWDKRSTLYQTAER